MKFGAEVGGFRDELQSEAAALESLVQVFEYYPCMLSSYSDRGRDFDGKRNGLTVLLPPGPCFCRFFRHPVVIANRSTQRLQPGHETEKLKLKPSASCN